MGWVGERRCRERSSARTQEALLQRLRDEWGHAAGEERELQMALAALGRERAEVAVRCSPHQLPLPAVGLPSARVN
jgi:hypothetical protein